MYRIGIDLGGTNIKVGIVNGKNEIVVEKSIPTRVERDKETIIQDMINITMQLIKEKNMPLDKIKGMGIGSAGVIDTYNGVVLYSNNFNWQNVELVKEMKKTIKFPIHIANDAHCAALGEVRAGAAKNCDNIVLLTLGTGVGSGIIVNGKIFEGGYSGGGILGHTVIRKDGEDCTCGRKGCLEAYVSANALIRDTKKAAVEYPDSIINKVCQGDLSKIEGKTVFQAQEDGDKMAKRVIQNYIENLGDGIVNIINIFRPQKVLLSGGICNQGDNLTKPLNIYVQENCFAGSKIFIPTVEKAILGNKAGMIGAAWLV